jgi:lysine-N-methylase
MLHLRQQPKAVRIRDAQSLRGDPLHPAQPTYSAYAQAFRCIGPACEDTCCQGWNVPIDRVSYEKFQSLPSSPLRTLIADSVSRNVESAPTGTDLVHRAPESKTAVFAQIRIDAAGHCPLLTADRLCRIHAELGEEMLPRTCSTYPRIVHEYGGVSETALALSCPEAARLVLLNRDLLAAKPQSLQQPAVNLLRDSPQQTDPAQGNNALPHDFQSIRASILALVQTRSYPLWQRIFLLGLMCRRLDSIARGELKRSVPEFLADFKAAVRAGALRAAMETLPVDRPAQLDVVLRLAGLLLHRSSVGPRFAACVQAFTTGIGNGPGATLESLTRQYTLAHDSSFEPFVRRHPHILENYLINTIIRCQFPFGREGIEPGATPRMSLEFARLTAQFVLIRGLLIGVAGFHGAAFSTQHVVSTVQAAAKHFEHHPEFLKLSCELLVESQMDGARGMAILLRNTEPGTTATEQPRAHQPVPNPPGPSTGVSAWKGPTP